MPFTQNLLYCLIGTHPRAAFLLALNLILVLVAVLVFLTVLVLVVILIFLTILVIHVGYPPKYCLRKAPGIV